MLSGALLYANYRNMLLSGMLISGIQKLSFSLTEFRSLSDQTSDRLFYILWCLTWLLTFKSMMLNVLDSTLVSSTSRHQSSCDANIHKWYKEIFFSLQIAFSSSLLVKNKPVTLRLTVNFNSKLQYIFLFVFLYENVHNIWA